MQVFMPYPNLQRSVSCLDPHRFGNQVYREAKTLISGSWPNHPAAKIWADHKCALAQYALHGLAELSKRGRPYPKWEAFFREELAIRLNPNGSNLFKPHILYMTVSLPPIIGYEPFHAGHRAALLAKGLMDTTWKMAQNASECPTSLGTCPKRNWTWDNTQEVCNLLGGPPETWYSQFGWTETPEPDTKKAYIWSRP